MRSDRRDKEPHVLVIDEVRADEGEVDWHVEHLPTCGKHEHLDEFGPGKFVRSTYYECGVAWVLGEVGLDAISDEGWQPQVGRHNVVACSVYDEYTHESDAWLEVVEEV